MANDILGSELNISGLEDGIARIEKKMTALSANVTRNSNNIVKAFQEISSQGVNALVGKLNELNSSFLKIKVSEGVKGISTHAKKAADDVVKLSNALKEQSNIAPNQKVKDNAIQVKKAYEEQLRIYEKLFAQADKKRPDLINKGNTLQSINAIDARLNDLMKKINRLNNEMQLFKSMESGQTLKTQDYAYIGQVADSLKKLIAEYESLYNKRAQLQQQLKTYKTEEEKLAQAQLSRQKNQTYNTTAKGALEFSDNAKSINRQQKAIEYLTQARAKLNLTTSEGQRQAEQLTQRIRQHEDTLKRATRTEQENANAIRRRNEALTRQRQLEQQKRISSSPQEAMAYSRTTKTINEQIMAIQALKTARDRLTVQQAGGQMKYAQEMVRLNAEISRQQALVDTLRGKQQQLGQSQMNLMNIGRQLGSQLAMVFSVSAIQGYINKMVSVRAEFELQQRSLQAILQNKAKADELWGQTVQLALKSPFRVKELVSYTKQLAAYRIETDKLHETTKRLADVSAGLGVDMQRLILAYGQVRAAEYLRGTELRQFTEAGIPMLDELAKYFTEMEGRTVSTAEVFERISKRMVEFGDVAEVFNRITSAGGVFYEMQEKQADTLHGQISNLHDALDLMMNDIGKGSDSTLKSFVAGLRAIVDNWEEVWVRIKEVIIALGAYKIAAIAAGLATEQTGGILLTMTNSWGKYARTLKITNAMYLSLLKGATAGQAAMILLGNGLRVATIAAIGLGRAMSAILPVLLIAGIFELINTLGEASREAERLKEALSGVDAELGKDLEKSISTYERLARTISDGTKSYTERDEAMQELKRTFSDILPSMYLERDTILEMAGNYDKATSALRVYYDEKARIQKLEKLDEHYQDSFSTDMKESWVDDIINVGVGGIQEDEYLKILSSVIEKGKEATKNGILWDKETLQKELADALQQYYSFSDAIRKNLERNLDVGTISHNLGDLIDLLVKYQKDYSTISGLPVATKAEKKQSEALSKMRKEYDEYKKTLAEINSLYGKYANLQKKSRQTGEKINVQDVKDIEKELKEKYEKLKVEIPVSFSDVSDNTLAMQKEIDRVTTSMNTNFVNTMSGFGDKIKIATGGIYTMNTALAGMSKTPMPPMLSNINILNTDVNNLTQGINKTGTAVDFLNTIGKPKFFTFLPNAVTDINNVEGATAKLAETVISESDKVVDNTYQNFVNNIVESVAKANGVQMNMLNDLVVGANATSASVKQTWKNQYDELVARHAMAKQILAENPLLTVNYVYSLTGIEAKSEEELKKIIKSYEESWKKVGFDIKDLVPEKKKQKGKKTDPAKDFANMLKEIRDSYEDLNDWMDKNDAITRTTTNWRKVFEDAAKGVKGLNLAWEDFDFTTVEGLVSALEKLQKVAKTKKTKDDIGKTIGQETTKQDEETAKKRADARDKEIDQLFELYDLYKELDKLDFPKELAKSLFGIDATSLNEIRSELEQNSYRFVGEEGKKKYQEYLDKITELENKEQIERLKTYTKYLVEGMNERVKIKLEELNKIAEVESMAQYSDSEKKRIKESIQKETKEKLDKQTWEDFTQSDMYIQIFQDLDNTSDAVIKAMLNRLQSLKESLKDLSPDKVKDIVKEMDKLSDELNERKNPFELITSNLKTYINYLKNKNELEKRYTKSQDNISSLENERDAQADKVAKLKQEYKTIVSIEGTNSTNAKQLKIQLDVAENILDVTLKRLVAEGKISQELADQIRNGKTAGKTVSSSISNLASNTREVHSAFTSITDSIQNIFGEFDEQTKDVLDSIGQVMGGVATMEEGISSIMEGKVFTGVLNIFSGLGQTIAGFFGFGNGDKKKERQIQKETELVEKLERAYEKLEKAIDAAYSFDTYSAASKNAETNIKQRIESNKRMIQLEKDKKGTDEERIKEWEEQNKDLEEQLADLYVQRFTDATDGILDDTRSAAREFVDAWLDAWLELGNGMSGLEESFNEMLKNMLKQQATMLIAGGYLENWKKDLEKYINPNDLELTTDEARKWVSKVTSDLPKLNDSLTAYFEALKKAGIDLTTTQGSELSGLQEGIQGITEETAQIIEAYLNSIRFYIAQDNQNLADLRNFFIGSDDNVNPMLAQLKIIATQTTAINSLLESLTAPHPTQSGRGLKVII